MRYIGPEGQANHDVGLETGEGSLLEPNTVYEVSAELADKLARTALWERVQDFDDLNVTQLRSLAKERGVTGTSKLDKDGLIAALRGETDAGDSDGNTGAAAANDDGEGGDES